jgi:toxin ParE1/3/4
MKLVVLDAVEENDLNAIYDYIAADNPVAAFDLVISFQEKFNFLLENPRAGRFRPELRSDLRGFPVGEYLILYRVLEDVLEIVYVAHGRRDLPELVKREFR